jgi:hypothetical protein
VVRGFCHALTLSWTLRSDRGGAVDAEAQAWVEVHPHGRTGSARDPTKQGSLGEALLLTASPILSGYSIWKTREKHVRRYTP